VSAAEALERKPTCLFVAQRIGTGRSGATVVANRNLHHCDEIFGEGLEVYKIEKGRIPHILRKLLQVFGYVDGLLPRDLKAIAGKLKSGGFDFIFFDTSYFGLAARRAARSSPGTKIAIFYHDILVDWWRESRTGSAFRKVFWEWNYRRMESLSTRYSSIRLFMTERDRGKLLKEYGAGGGSLVPVSVVDRFSPPASAPRAVAARPA
jgi:hypothetical protein